MDQRHIPYKNRAINNPKAYFWTTDEEPEFVREVTDVDINNPVPKGYEVRQDLPIVVSDEVDSRQPALLTAYQHWNVPTIEEGDTYAVSVIPLGDEEAVNNLIDALIEVKERRWPYKAKHPRPVAYETAAPAVYGTTAEDQEKDPFSYGGTYRHPLDMD